MIRWESPLVGRPPFYSCAPRASAGGASCLVKGPGFPVLGVPCPVARGPRRRENSGAEAPWRPRGGAPSMCKMYSSYARAAPVLRPRWPSSGARAHCGVRAGWARAPYSPRTHSGVRTGWVRAPCPPRGCVRSEHGHPPSWIHEDHPHEFMRVILMDPHKWGVPLAPLEGSKQLPVPAEDDPPGCSLTGPPREPRVRFPWERHPFHGGGGRTAAAPPGMLVRMPPVCCSRGE